MDRLVWNFDELTTGPRAKIRADALNCIQAGIRAAIPGQNTRRLVRLEGHVLHISGEKYDLDELGSIYVVGAGKGSYPIAFALEEILGDRIAAGLVAVKSGDRRRLSHIEVVESSHPLPDERSAVFARKLCDLLRRATEKDLVFAAITGGSSAMCNLPPEGVSMEDLSVCSDLLLRSGAPITEINTVRRHLCGLKGGRMAALAQPATLITITLDTAPPGLPWPDLSAADPTTFHDAVSVLKNRDLWESVPSSVRGYLEESVGKPERETLKSLDGLRQTILFAASPADACEAAAQAAEEMGYFTHILSTSFRGEAHDLGLFLAGVCNEIHQNDRPFHTPCALISGGETTVSFHGKNGGAGGPNQETALAFATELSANSPLAFAAVDTDGTDGPCEAAGGIIDDTTPSNARILGLDLRQALRLHNTLPVLQELNGLIETGHTGTNVMNLRVLLIG